MGSLPSALFYALAGAVSATFQNTSLVFGAMVLLAGVFWVMSKFVQVRSADRGS
jgi:uncharacterized membrane protein HdeD (DUF308 family)